jgi:hypothetical protein
MKTEPIGFDHLMPLWVARCIATAAALVLVAIICVLAVSFAIPPSDAQMGLVLIAAVCATVLWRAWKVSSWLRDDRLRAGIRKFIGLTQTRWDEMMLYLADDPEVELLYETRAMMANPLTWGRKQSVLVVREGDLVAYLLESNGLVGSVRLERVIR